MREMQDRLDVENVKVSELVGAWNHVGKHIYFMSLQVILHVYCARTYGKNRPMS